MKLPPGSNNKTSLIHLTKDLSVLLMDSPLGAMYCQIKTDWGSSHRGSVVTTRLGSMRVQGNPWPREVGYGSGAAVSCGGDLRHDLDPSLLWLWCWLVATALILPLAWEPPYPWTINPSINQSINQSIKKTWK